jgi:Gly-Xaa carboxypeptidase
MIKMFGTVAALPGVAEKGYLDVVVDVTSPGGHSSVPPDHTGRRLEFFLSRFVLT